MDDRVRVPLNGKAVDLAQLSAEVATGLTASESEVVVADADAPVSTEQMQAALDAHVPAPKVDPEAAFHAAVEGATTIAQLKAVLLGQSGPGAEPRRSAPAP